MNFKVGQVWKSRGGNYYIIDTYREETLGYEITAHLENAPHKTLLLWKGSKCKARVADDLIELIKDVGDEVAMGVPMNFEIGKTYVTKQGKKLRLIHIATEAEPGSQLIFLDDTGEIRLRHLNGRFDKNSPTDKDIVTECKEPPKPTEVECWAVLSSGGTFIRSFNYRSQAVEYADLHNGTAIKLRGTYIPAEK